MMKRLGVPSDFSNLCQDIYSDSSQQVRSKEGYTADIPIKRGIKQGCPLSPLLFNLVLEGILPTLEGMDGGYTFENGSTVRILAYVDDLCLLGHTKEAIQTMLDKLYEFCLQARLTFNPSKCGALSMINSPSRKYVEPFHPNLGQDPIPALKWEDRYKYLGIQTGRERLRSMDELETSIVSDAEKILNSALTDWQKIDAINTFVLTKASYFLCTYVLNRTWATKIDAKIRRLVKKATKLPKRTISAFFHASRDHAGLGLVSLVDSMDTAQVTRVLRCLSSPDQLVQNVAWSQLSSVTRIRLKKKELETTDYENLLNNPPLPQEATVRDVRSLWTTVRKSLKRLSCSIHFQGSDVHLEHQGDSAKADQRKAVTNLLKKARNQLWLGQLLKSKDQGRAFHQVHMSPASNHWIQSGAFTSFAEYRFAVKA